MSVRAALGAGRGRIVRQLLTESVLLSVAGGGLGVLLAFRGIDLLLAFGQASLPRASEIHVDGWVLGFSRAVTIGTGVLFGLLPALAATPPPSTFIRCSARARLSMPRWDAGRLMAKAGLADARVACLPCAGRGRALALAAALDSHHEFVMDRLAGGGQAVLEARALQQP